MYRMESEQVSSNQSAIATEAESIFVNLCDSQRMFVMSANLKFVACES